MASSDNILDLAKQGNPEAIQTLLNRSLQSKGITAKTALRDNCLQIMLESAQIPNQQAAANFIYKGITSLGINSINIIKIYGKQIDDNFPAWNQDINLTDKTGENSSIINLATKDSVEEYSKNKLTKDKLKYLASKGDIDAITEILELAMPYEDITILTKLNNDYLKIILDSEYILEKEELLTIIHDELIDLNLLHIQAVKIYAMHTDENFPEWEEEFEINTKQQNLRKNNVNKLEVVPNRMNLAKEQVNPNAKLSYKQKDNALIRNWLIFFISCLVLALLFKAYPAQVFMFLMGVVIIAALYAFGSSKTRYKTEYEKAKALLRKNPNNPALREAALIAGRNYYRSLRIDGMLTIYDEQAIANDLAVISSSSYR